MRNSLDYAIAACDTMIKKFEAKNLPPVGRFHYHQGVFLSGMQKVFYLTNETKYYEYIKAWVDSVLREDGSFTEFMTDELDDMQPGILLFDLYERTGEKQYKIALDKIADILKDWNCNSEGGFWHKDMFPEQMWLDGMYMAGPFMTEYGEKFDYAPFFETVHLQMELMKKHNTDKKTGLMYHAWDAVKKQSWADEVTGCSAEFWGRAIGWFVVAMFDIAEKLPESFSKRQDFVNTGIELVKAIFKYQDKESGLWYQVVDKGERADNWTEVSCSCLFIYAVCKAIRLGFLNADDYAGYIKKGYEGIISTLGFTNEGDVLVNKVCVGTGVADYGYYIRRPTSTNDLHGMGAFILMCCEYFKAMGDDTK